MEELKTVILTEETGSFHGQFYPSPEQQAEHFSEKLQTLIPVFVLADTPKIIPTLGSWLQLV